MEALTRPCLPWLAIVWSTSLFLGMVAVLFAPGSPSSTTCLLGAIDRCGDASILFKQRQSHDFPPKLPSMHVSSSHLAPLVHPPPCCVFHSLRCPTFTLACLACRPEPFHPSLCLGMCWGLVPSWGRGRPSHVRATNRPHTQQQQVHTTIVRTIYGGGLGDA